MISSNTRRTNYDKKFKQTSERFRGLHSFPRVQSKQQKEEESLMFYPNRKMRRFLLYIQFVIACMQVRFLKCGTIKKTAFFSQKRCELRYARTNPFFDELLKSRKQFSYSECDKLHLFSSEISFCVGVLTASHVSN